MLKDALNIFPQHRRLARENAVLKAELTMAKAFQETPSYSGDFLATWNKSVSFLDDPKFMSAYRRGMNSGHAIGRPRGSDVDIHIEWRIHTCCWAGAHAAKLPGDFVECGTNTGIMSLAVCEYVDFNTLDKTFWLFDTFNGTPLGQMTNEERSEDRSWAKLMYFECYEMARANFAPFKNARLVAGQVPATLSGPKIDRVAYLCIDMNIVTPEIAAMEYFWPKLVPGAVVVLDDYGWKQCVQQKKAHDEFAKANGFEIMLLPTGQGLIVKP
jgi:hypothetical protein